MDKIKIEGIPAYDGEYEVDFENAPFTNRELHTIKRLAGVRAGEVEKAMEAGDNDMLVAVTVIALTRHGKRVDEDVIWDAEAGKIDYIVGESEEVDADPPALPKTEPGLAATPDESGGSSGPHSSNAGGDLQGNSPSSTGSQASEITALSAPGISAS